jgi:hypothetical protein
VVEPLGRSGLGDVYDHRFLVLPNYSFTQPGKYKFTIQQENRQDTFGWCLAIGLRVETALASEQKKWDSCEPHFKEENFNH